MAQFCLAQSRARKILALHPIHRHDTAHIRQSHGPHDLRWHIFWNAADNLTDCSRPEHYPAAGRRPFPRSLCGIERPPPLRHIKSMSVLIPIGLAVVVGVFTYLTSARQTKRTLATQSSPLRNPALDALFGTKCCAHGACDDSQPLYSLHWALDRKSRRQHDCGWDVAQR